MTTITTDRPRATMYDAILEISGKAYKAQLGKVDEAQLIPWGEGMCWSLAFTFDGAGQGTGAYGLSGMKAAPTLNAIITLFGVDDWSKITGQRVYVLREKCFGPIRGIANVDEPDKRWLLFSEFSDVDEATS